MLGELLDAETDAYQLYHRSFADFLLPAAALLAAMVFMLPSSTRGSWRVIDRPAGTWTTTTVFVTSMHSAALRDPALFEVIDTRLMRAKLPASDPTSHSPRDVHLAVAAAIAADLPNVAEEARSSLLLATLGGVAGSAPLSALSVLVRRGEVERALGYARLIASPKTAPAPLATLAADAPDPASLLDEASAGALVLRDPQQRIRAIAAVVRGSVESRRTASARITRSPP